MYVRLCHFHDGEDGPELLVLNAHGDPVARREAGCTLVIYTGQVTVRIESQLSRDAAICLARSLH
jgi:hypothetical protein